LAVAFVCSLSRHPENVISTEAPHSFIVRRAVEKSAFVFAFVAVVAFAVAPVLTQQNQTMAISIEATRSHTSQATTDSRSSPLLLLLGRAGLQPGV